MNRPGQTLCLVIAVAIWMHGVLHAHAFAQSEPAEADVGMTRTDIHGPFPVSSQSPFQSLRPTMVPGADAPMREGKWLVRLNTTLANVWINECDRYVLDFETLDNVFALQYGWLPNMTVGVRYEERSVFGGILDGWIESFHRLTHIEQAGRDDVPHGRMSFALYPEGKPSVSVVDEKGVYSRRLSADWRWRVLEAKSMQPSVSLGMSIDMDVYTSPFVEKDFPIDVGWFIGATERLGPIWIYLQAGFNWYGAEYAGGLEQPSSAWAGLLAVEWPVSQISSVIVQYRIDEGAVKHFGSFSDPVHEVLLGGRWRFAKRFLLEAALLENVFIYDNSPDFGVHLGLKALF